MGTGQRSPASFRSGGGWRQTAEGRCGRSAGRHGVFFVPSSESCSLASPLPGSAPSHAHPEPSSLLATTQPERRLPPAPPPQKLSGQLRLRRTRLRRAASRRRSPGSSETEEGLVSWAGRGARWRRGGWRQRWSLPLSSAPAPTVPSPPLLQPPQCTIPPRTPPQLPQPPPHGSPPPAY